MAFNPLEPLEPSILEARQWIESRLPGSLREPLFGIVCGSGLGGLADSIVESRPYEAFNYGDIPNCPKSTGESRRWSTDASLQTDVRKLPVMPASSSLVPSSKRTRTKTGEWMPSILPDQCLIMIDLADESPRRPDHKHVVLMVGRLQCVASAHIDRSSEVLAYSAGKLL